MSVLGVAHRANQMLEELKKESLVCPIECSNVGSEMDIIRTFRRS